MLRITCFQEFFVTRSMRSREKAPANNNVSDSLTNPQSQLGEDLQRLLREAIKAMRRRNDMLNQLVLECRRAYGDDLGSYTDKARQYAERQIAEQQRAAFISAPNPQRTVTVSSRKKEKAQPPTSYSGGSRAKRQNFEQKC
ncbi:hypothetical protein B7494_g8443 [Chlorociboria aeruginascens]|nr:hypothetical protein B7494_g8443 [Chlorociboria aeruginascens]